MVGDSGPDSNRNRVTYIVFSAGITLLTAQQTENRVPTAIADPGLLVDYLRQH